MATKGQMTGMLGTYLAAAELTHKGLIGSVTSRNARGADLLATDQDYKRTWSIQVKTNRKAASFWLLSKDYTELSSPGDKRWPGELGVAASFTFIGGTTASG